MTALPVNIVAPPVNDGLLRVVRVDGDTCTLNPGGEVLFMRREELRILAEQVCQEQCPVTIIIWWTKSDGYELMELHRVGGTGTDHFTEIPSEASEVL